MLPERDNIWPEAIIAVVILLLFYIVGWYLVKPSFSTIGKQVHYINSEQYFQSAKQYIMLENIEVRENIPVEITLGELKSKGYFGEGEELIEYVTVFSRARNFYSNASKIVILKNEDRYQYFIRLCPSSETTCDRNSKTLLDTIK